MSHWSILSFIDGVVSGLLFSSVLSLMLNSVEGLKDSVVTSLFFFSVENVVLIGESDFRLIFVVSDGVWSLKNNNLSSVSVFLFFSVENVVVSLVSGEWNILIFGLSVVSINSSWLEGVSIVGVWSVGDLVVLGVSSFMLFPVQGLSLMIGGGVGNLAGSDFSLSLVTDRVLSLLVDDLNISVSGLLTVFGVGVWIIFVRLDGSNRADQSSDEFHGK